MNIAELDRILTTRGPKEAASTALAAGLDWAAAKIRRGEWEVRTPQFDYEGKYFNHRLLKSLGTLELIGVYTADDKDVLVQYVIREFVNGSLRQHAPLPPTVDRNNAEFALDVWREPETHH